ncbi:MAG: protein-L-isoaspartate O-methyltransferase [Alphaproteobacteria bacterium]|nr:MAG: protein-L-isoaspartate O-methyltransferase [Alphaproteobacteria bacterium]
MIQTFEQARENMVECQLRPNKVTDATLLDAVRKIPREQFVPRHLQSVAYVDEDVPLGNGRYLREPVIGARLIQEAGVLKDDIVLDIGCNTGYSTAVLGHLAGTVVALEAEDHFADEAEKLLHDLDICNVVVVRQKDLREGYAQQGPYDVIFINGSIPAVPARIKAQLADGGRLVTVISERGHMGTATLVTRNGDSFSSRALFDAATPTLKGFETAKTFVF